MRYIMKGGTPLAGDVTISGAKNAALGILAAAIMTDEPVTIENLPNVSDINVMLEAMKEIGVVVERIDSHIIKINGANIHTVVVNNEHIKKIRAGYYLLGALAGKYRHAEVARPGGCAIGERPIDLHLYGFRMLGMDAVEEMGMVRVDAPRLTGGKMYLNTASVGATINIMLAAVLAKGETVIDNAAKEPHVVDVANMLNKMGARVRGAGTDNIRIRGVERLHGTTYPIIPDQIEAGTFMFAAAITRGDVTVRNITPQHMDAISAKLREMGCEVIEGDDSIRVVGKDPLRACDVKTLPYPGFPTDMQPQITATLCTASGYSVIKESIFESRFEYVGELRKMGAHARKTDPITAVVAGVKGLTGAEVEAPDLRAGAALVLAGLSAKGITTVSNIDFILRGYEDFDKKLRGLGAVIEIIGDAPEEARKFRFRVS